jgi:hypothetical protein
MNKDDYRIIIPAKKESERSPEKNNMLLGWTLEYVCRLRLQDKTALLSQHEGYLMEARNRGIHAITESENYPDQIPAVYQVIQEMGWQEKLIIMLQPTQPLRQYWLVQRCLEMLRDSPSDLVTTCSLREEKLHVFKKNEDGSYATDILYQPLLTAAVIAMHAATLGKYENHLAMWKERSTHLVPHKYPGNMDFDYPEDMISVPLITPSVFDLFYYSEE